jgi:hypothetical protein
VITGLAVAAALLGGALLSRGTGIDTPEPAPSTELSATPSAAPSAVPTTGGAGPGAAVAKAPVRVYNNSLIRGLAERAADDMRSQGWPVTEVGTFPEGNVPTSTVYYRRGTDEEVAARSLASSFGLRISPRYPGIQDASPGVIVIVTKDYQRR